MGASSSSHSHTKGQGKCINKYIMIKALQSIDVYISIQKSDKRCGRITVFVMKDTSSHMFEFECHTNARVIVSYAMSMIKKHLKNEEKLYMCAPGFTLDKNTYKQEEESMNTLEQDLIANVEYMNCCSSLYQEE
jgi:hypothetical protein